MELTFEEAGEILAEHDSLCKVCKFRHDDCDGRIIGGPTGPIYPPCADGDYQDILDPEEAVELATEIKNGEA